MGLFDFFNVLKKDVYSHDAEAIKKQADAFLKEQEAYKTFEPIFPDMKMPYIAPRSFLDDIDTIPVKTFIKIQKDNEAKMVFEHWLGHICAYIGEFMKLNKENPYIKIDSAGIAQEQLECAMKLSFLYGILKKDDAELSRAQALKITIIDAYYPLENTKLTEWSHRAQQELNAILRNYDAHDSETLES